MRKANGLEVNFDCIVGPTHHFGGLSLGNIASAKNKFRPSSPKKAALQGLEKMYMLYERGFCQGVLPPHPRPFLNIAHLPGFEHNQYLLSALTSSSFMWTANMATVSPSFDCKDGRVHFTVANLQTMFHRHFEKDFSFRLLKKVFSSPDFVIHPALFSHDLFSDEGAANHNRLCPKHDANGLEILVYGKESLLSSQKSQVYPARQSKEASNAIMLQHGLHPDRTFLVEQHPLAIDAGAFHNDVVAVANESVFLLHAKAFVDQDKFLAILTERYQHFFLENPTIIEISDQDLSLKDAVHSYIFNSQLLTKPDGGMLLFAAKECEQNPQAKKVIHRLIAADNPIDEIAYFDVSQSMANGGGPACLRLRVVLSEQERQNILPSVLLNENNYQELRRIIDDYYVDNFSFDLIRDESFLRLCKESHEAICQILGLIQLDDE